MSDSSRQQVLNAIIGRDIHISRDSNVTTGYGYDILLSPGLSLLHHEYIPSERARQQVPGAGGRETWTIRVNKGSHEYILLWYHQPWERPDISDAELITVNIGSTSPTSSSRGRGIVTAQNLETLTIYLSDSRLVGFNYRNIQYGEIGDQYKVFLKPETSQVRLTFYDLDGELVYLRSPMGCDMINCLFDMRGRELGCPLGGLSGKGDRSNPNFLSRAKELGSMKWPPSP